MLLLPYATKYWALVVFSCAYGTSDGVFLSTANYILLSCVDEKRKTAAFYIECLLYSFSVATGGPIAGKTFSRRICRGTLLRLPLNYRPFHVPVLRFLSLKLGGKAWKGYCIAVHMPITGSLHGSNRKRKEKEEIQWLYKEWLLFQLSATDFKNTTLREV